MTLLRHSRPGTTFVELILFLAFFSVVSGVLITFFFTTAEQRVRQDSISTVEQAGVQIAQALKTRIRSAERLLDPPLNSSGSVLALQIADEAINPTVVALSGTTLVVAQANTMQNLSSNKVSVSNLHIVNTSASASRGSVLLTYTISRTIPLTVPINYERNFEVFVSLFPDDVESTQCDCIAPACNSGNYEWEYCEEETCYTATGSISC